MSRYRKNRKNLETIALALVLLLVALVCSNVTLASGDYRGVLLAGLAATAAAGGCIAMTFARGSRGWRIAAAALALCGLAVAVDLVARASRVFGSP